LKSSDFRQRICSSRATLKPSSGLQYHAASIARLPLHRHRRLGGQARGKLGRGGVAWGLTQGS